MMFYFIECLDGNFLQQYLDKESPFEWHDRWAPDFLRQLLHWMRGSPPFPGNAGNGSGVYEAVIAQLLCLSPNMTTTPQCRDSAKAMQRYSYASKFWW
jgi:hypothetical protein